MIDIKALRANPKAYQESASARGIKVDIKNLLELDKERSGLISKIDPLRSKLNTKGKPTDAELVELKQAKAELEQLESQYAKLDQQYQDLLWQLPNLLAEDTPKGGEEASLEVRRWGEATESSNSKDHLTLAVENDWIDFERGAKVAGNKFYFLKGSLVKLEMALKRLGLDIAEQAGFLPMDVPHMVNSRVLAGTGFAPRGEEEQHVYKIEGEDLSLIATAELPLTGYHADETLTEAKTYAGWSPSYRREAGAYGKHSKGLFRVHQFNKLELYVFCAPEESEEWHSKLIAVEEKIIQALEIPYRVTRTASGDLGAPAYKKFDIEYWSPVDKAYRELTSCSNCTDYQARRLGVKYKTPDGNVIAHTLNGTAVPISRAIIAVLENHQQPDGTVKLPQALAKLYGGETL